MEEEFELRLPLRVWLLARERAELRVEEELEVEDETTWSDSTAVEEEDVDDSCRLTNKVIPGFGACIEINDRFRRRGIGNVVQVFKSGQDKFFVVEFYLYYALSFTLKHF